jgi:hypothetical protein
MQKSIVYLISAGLGISIVAAGAQAQGISNSRDGNGNLIERGAATRTYPTTPMANSTIAPAPPPQGYVVIKNRGTVMIRPRQ